MDTDNHSRTRSICISYPSASSFKRYDSKIPLFCIFGLMTLPSIHEKPSQLVHDLNTSTKTSWVRFTQYQTAYNTVKQFSNHPCYHYFCSAYVSATTTHTTDVARCHSKSTSCTSSNDYAGLPIYIFFSFENWRVTSCPAHSCIGFYLTC